MEFTPRICSSGPGAVSVKGVSRPQAVPGLGVIHDSQQWHGSSSGNTLLTYCYKAVLDLACMRFLLHREIPHIPLLSFSICLFISSVLLVLAFLPVVLLVEKRETVVGRKGPVV